MRSLTRGNVKMALGSLRATRWRSLLTMLGVIIGVLSVVTIVSIGEGIKQQVNGQINRLGKDLITVRPGDKIIRGTGSSFNSINILSGLSNATTLSTHDWQVIQTTSQVKTSVPLSIVPGVVQAYGNKYQGAVVIGSTDSIPTVLNQTVQYGEFFKADDMQKNVAVIGANLAERVFGTQVPLGQSFTFHNQEFVVRGILNSFDTTPFSLDTDFNNAIFIPYPIAESLNNNSAPIYEILVKPTDPKYTTDVVQSINNKLLEAHSGQHDYNVLKQDENLAVGNNILTLLTTLISGIAAISLVVGGIGIMNVTLVSVTERTHEIGIRKALGATNRQILSQFLIEATVLSLFGGMVAVMLSLLANVALRIFTNLTPVISWQVMILAVGISLGVGIVFGITPALKAARMDPIEALRHE